MSETNEHLQADGSSEDKPRRGHNNPPDAVSEYAAARDEAKRYLLGLIRDEIKQDTSKIGWLERAYRMYLPVERDNTARALFEDDLKGFRIKPTKSPSGNDIALPKTRLLSSFIFGLFSRTSAVTTTPWQILFTAMSCYNPDF
jgi:hypothetical protein